MVDKPPTRRAAQTITKEPDPAALFRETWEANGLPGSREHAALANVLERAQRKMDAMIEGALKPLGLSRSRFELLLRLSYSEAGSFQLGQLSGMMLLHATSVTSLVDRLERAGFVRRLVPADDRRAILAEITPKGMRAVQAGAKALGAIEFGVPQLSAKEATALRKQLMKLL